MNWRDNWKEVVQFTNVYVLFIYLEVLLWKLSTTDWDFFDSTINKKKIDWKNGLANLIKEHRGLGIQNLDTYKTSGYWVNGCLKFSMKMVYGKSCLRINMLKVKLYHMLHKRLVILIFAWVWWGRRINS